MNTSLQHLEIRGIPVAIVHKDIKNLHVGVYPPDGRVRIAAPLRLSDEAIRLAVISRLGWISRQQLKFERQDRQTQREIVTGESHFLWGRRYRLDVVESSVPQVEVLNNRTLQVCVRQGTNTGERRAVLSKWYRRQLREQISSVVEKWEPRVGVRMSKFGIRKMKTRWGSCNARSRQIWVNLELVKKPPICVEYIVVHEMVHLLEPHHGDRFQAYMDELMPPWRHIGMS